LDVRQPDQVNENQQRSVSSQKGGTDTYPFQAVETQEEPFLEASYQVVASLQKNSITYDGYVRQQTMLVIINFTTQYNE